MGSRDACAPILNLKIFRCDRQTHHLDEALLQSIQYTRFLLQSLTPPFQEPTTMTVVHIGESNLHSRTQHHPNIAEVW